MFAVNFNKKVRIPKNVLLLANEDSTGFTFNDVVQFTVLPKVAKKQTATVFELFVRVGNESRPVYMEADSIDDLMSITAQEAKG